MSATETTYKTSLINNRRYLGNKYKLLSFITCVVNDECADIETVADIVIPPLIYSNLLFPLNSSRWLARNIVTDSVDILDLVYNSYACLFKHVIRDSCKVGGHKVAGCNAS